MKKKTAGRRGRSRAYRLQSQIYALLNSGEWVIRFARLGDDPRLRDKLGHGPNTIGLCDDETHILYIDHRQDVLATIVHECLHAIYPDKGEPEIRRLEKLVMGQMSSIQAKRLFLLAACALTRPTPSD